MVRPNDIEISPHFRLREFEDPSTRTVMLDPGLLEMLEVVRYFYGKPIRISSGYRTQETNTAVGGMSFSRHLSGKAADVPVTGEAAADLAAAARTAGFRKDQILIETDHVHLEVD